MGRKRLTGPDVKCTSESENFRSAAKRQRKKTPDSLRTLESGMKDSNQNCVMPAPVNQLDKNKTDRKLERNERKKRQVTKSVNCVDQPEKASFKVDQSDRGKLEVNQSGRGRNVVDQSERSTFSVKESQDTSIRNDTFLQDLLCFGFGKKPVKLEAKPVHLPWQTSHNLIHTFQQLSYGGRCSLQLQKAIRNPVIYLTKNFELYRTASPFDRRVTALEWHPTKPSVLAVGSKGGDILLWDTDSVYKEKLVHGIGAAGSCQALKFWPWDTTKVVSASINGTVTLHDFETQSGTVLADTMNSYDHWYCSVDVNPSRYLVVAGRNGGILHLMSTEGRKVFEYRLHKNKITHVEFSPREEWLFCTASTDQTVQMWDVRYMKDRKSVISVLHHDKPVNSAYFNPKDGCRLLTTDQNKEIRVYRAPFWHLETNITHPHRFFQHISPFKATWHPLEDLIVCGRYPDKNTPGSSGMELRTLDIFDADSGDIVSQLYSQGTDGLCPLNKFNRQGDALASGMGFHILLWNRKQEIARKQSLVLKEGLKHLSDFTDSGNLATGSANQRSRSRPRQQKKKKTEDVDDLKKKLKTKSKEKTETKSIEKTETKSKEKTETKSKEKTETKSKEKTETKSRKKPKE